MSPHSDADHFQGHTAAIGRAVVGVLFPAYFRWGLACGAVALLSQLVLRGKNHVPACALLVVMLAFSAFQSFHVEPRAAAIKKEIVSFETTPKDHPLRKEFAKLHAISAVCNLAVFGGGVVLIILM